MERLSLKPSLREVRRYDQVPRLLDKGEECIVCSVCRSHKARYVCPSCFEPYCSAKCYSGHNISCSERFYKKRVQDELESREKNGEDEGLFCRKARWVGDLLKEVSRERLEALLKGAAPTPQEERMALEAAHRGELCLQAWKPWWMEDLYMSQADSGNERPRLFRASSTGEGLVRRLQTDVGPLDQPSRASPLLRFSLLDVLTAYARTARYFDGDFLDDPYASAACLVQCSPVLTRDARHESVAEALSSSSHQARSVLPAFSRASHLEHAAIVEDTARLISARSLAAAALLDAWRIAAIGEAPKPIVHKLRFLLRWTLYHALDSDFPSNAACCHTYIKDMLSNTTSTCANDSIPQQSSKRPPSFQSTSHIVMPSASDPSPVGVKRNGDAFHVVL